MGFRGRVTSKSLPPPFPTTSSPQGPCRDRGRTWRSRPSSSPPLSPLLIASLSLPLPVTVSLRHTAVGIDLGTTFSVVGFNQNGKVEIVTDAAGHRIFPSVVTYTDSGEILVAYEALAQLSKAPLNTIYNAKRFIGRRYQITNVFRFFLSPGSLTAVSMSSCD